MKTYLCVSIALVSCFCMALGQAPVPLRSAGSFAILAGTTVTNSGSSRVTGDVGVSPGTSVTGFGTGAITGTIHTSDSVVVQAMADLNSAYSNASAQSQGRVTVSGDLGGQTLTAGLYQSASSLIISSGNLTLDAKGNANALFIFQIATTLTTAASRQVVLAGGAMAANVFWQVGGSATLGANSVFKGAIMANQSVTLGTSSSVEGRVFAQTGAVITDTVTISTPAPSISAGGIVNAASYTAPIVAGSIVSVFGSNLAYGQESAVVMPLPYTLAGASFQVSGRSAPMFYASPSQVNIQIPWELAGNAQAQVGGTVGITPIPPQSVVMTAFAPAIFTVGSNQGAVLIAQTSQLAAVVSFGGGARPVNRGEFISIYCTGLGPVSNQPASGSPASLSVMSNTSTTPMVNIGGVLAQASFSGLAPGYVGLYQVNVQVPTSVQSGSAVPLALTMGAVASNTVNIAVQ